jgi:protein-S-isoprenylcysteine O-methyltransferase Ste14
MSTLLLVGFCWLFFGALHSMLIHLTIRRELQKILRVDDQTYKLFYALISVVSLFTCVLVTLLSHGKWVLRPDWFTFVSGAVLILGSFYLMRLSFKNYSLMVFIGLQPESKSKLKYGGMNRFVRHPLYLSTVLMLIGIMAFWPSDVIFTTCLILIAYTLIGARLEERKLIAQFGKAYLDYMREVPAFVPKWGDK